MWFRSDPRPQPAVGHHASTACRGSADSRGGRFGPWVRLRALTEVLETRGSAPPLVASAIAPALAETVPGSGSAHVARVARGPRGDALGTCKQWLRVKGEVLQVAVVL